MTCKNCNIPMKIERWTKQLKVNVYRLFDRHICKDCKFTVDKDLETVDKNKSKNETNQ